jgi:hypothetical protein
MSSHIWYSKNALTNYGNSEVVRPRDKICTNLDLRNAGTIKCGHGAVRIFRPLGQKVTSVVGLAANESAINRSASCEPKSLPKKEIIQISNTAMSSTKFRTSTRNQVQRSTPLAGKVHSQQPRRAMLSNLSCRSRRPC